MSALAEVKPGKSAEPVYNETLIYGKVSLVESFMTKNKERLWKHLVRLPSSGDEFETPGTVELIAKEKLGGEGELLKGLRCRITGYGRTFEVTDGDGVIKKVRTADVKLRLVD